MTTAMKTRTFQHTTHGHFKFWQVSYAQGAATVGVRWGRIGTKGQAQEKVFASPGRAVDFVLRAVAEKLGKGYVEVDIYGVPKPVPAAVAAPKAALKIPLMSAAAVAPSWAAQQPKASSVKKAALDLDSIVAAVECEHGWVVKPNTDYRECVTCGLRVSLLGSCKHPEARRSITWANGIRTERCKGCKQVVAEDKWAAPAMTPAPGAPLPAKPAEVHAARRAQMDGALPAALLRFGLTHAGIAEATRHLTRAYKVEAWEVHMAMNDYLDAHGLQIGTPDTHPPASAKTRAETSGRARRRITLDE